jgi:hypothetical protein
MYPEFDNAPMQKDVPTNSRKGNFFYNYPVVTGFILVLLAFLAAMMYVLKYAV